MKRKIRLYDYDFEVVVSQPKELLGDFSSFANYDGYPNLISQGRARTEDEAIDIAVRKLLADCPLEAAKFL